MKQWAFGILLASCGVVVGQDWETIYSHQSTVDTSPVEADSSNTEIRGVSDRGGVIAFSHYHSVVAENSPALLWLAEPTGTRSVAETGSAGINGPGRTTLESGHTFFNYRTYSTTSPLDWDDGGRAVFVARAGDPSLGRDFSTRGVWVHEFGANREIARAGRDDFLGPALGGGVIFEASDSDFIWRLMIRNDSDVFAMARTGQSTFTPTILRHDGGTWMPCAKAGSSIPALAPGIGATTFTWSGDAGWAVTSSNQIIATLRTSASREGVWRLCNGAPVPLAYEHTTGLLGPGMGTLSEFGGFVEASLIPVDDDAFYLIGSARVDSGSPFKSGIFRHSQGANSPVALVGESGLLSPQLPDTTFQSFSVGTASQAFAGNGEWIAFIATLTAPSGSVDGVFRFHPDVGLQPVIVLRSPAFALPSGDVWKSVESVAISPSGQVVVLGGAGPITSNDSTRAIWRSDYQGRMARRMLGPGDMIRYRSTSGGAASGMVTYVGSPTDDSPPTSSTGRNTWLSADGRALISISVQGHTLGHVVAGHVFNGSELFVDQFE